MATMRSTYPIKFNTTAIPYPNTWNETFDVVETPFRTEAGTDETIVTRFDKLSVDVSMNVLSSWVPTIGAFSKLQSFKLTRYNPITGQSEERTVRMRGFKCGLISGSQDLQTTATVGTWALSFKLEEF